MRATLALVLLMVAGCGDDAVAPVEVDAAAVEIDAGPDAGPTGPRANGTLGPWLAGPTMPLPRANHSSVVMGDDLLVIGGNYRPMAGAPFVRTFLINASKIAADGSLGAWREVGRLPSPVSECTTAAWGDKLLVIDGLYDDDTLGAQVWVATRRFDGTLTGFTSLGPLPTDLRTIAQEAWVVGDTLYVTSGRLPAVGDTMILLATTLGVTPLVWTELTITPTPGWRGQPQFVFTGNAVHRLGGYLGGSGQVVADTAWARLDDRTITPVGAGPSLLAPIAAGEAIAVDGFAFVVGGKPQIGGSQGQPATAVAPIAADGALGAWTASTPLPVGRTNHDLALGPTHLYLTGGSVDMGGLDTVFYAQVRFPPP